MPGSGRAAKARTTSGQDLDRSLDTHSAVSRVHGCRLKAKREIRVAALFRQAPADFLPMIVVHAICDAGLDAEKPTFTEP